MASLKPRLTNQRRVAIAEKVLNQGMARVIDLARDFSVSEVTIRNDLEILERDGHLLRDHGGATAIKSGRIVKSLVGVDERATQHLEQKQNIGRAAATLVNEGDNIIIDAGTTAVEMTPWLAGISPLTIVTNAINVALKIGAANSARQELILLGGTFHRESSSNLGPLTVHNLDEIAVQKLFLGTQALDLPHGLTDSTMEIAQVKRAMIRAAQRVILLTDSSKWDQSSFSKVAPLEEIDTLITDSAFPVAARAALEKLGVEVIIA